MRYAEVAVSAPAGHSRTFSYSVPTDYAVEPGQLVWVPFGRRVAQGIVTELASAPQVEVTKDILQPVEPSPLVNPVFLELGRWISSYYLCPLFDALALCLPPGFENQVRSRVNAVLQDEADDAGVLDELRPETKEALSALVNTTELAEADFLKSLGKNSARELRRLIDKKLVQRHVSLPRPRMTPRYQRYLFATNTATASEEDVEGHPALSERQAGLFAAIKESSGSYSYSVANKAFGTGVGQALVEKGLLGMEWRREEADPASSAEWSRAAPLSLTTMQADALHRITEALDEPAVTPRSFVLHGVTGSGKTEVYLQAIQHAVGLGMQAIYLVPEISLTPQTLDRLNARFPGRVAIIHSRLTGRQKFDQWWKIQSGGYDVVVGARSALFSPVERLGLVILDEEHEWTYKQLEAPPLYHARTVALELSRLSGAVVVMGSATPDVESYYFARDANPRRHRLLELTHRIEAEPGIRDQSMAQVEIVDMRRELKEGNRSIFSRRLSQSLKECVERRQQAILFLNRRGSAPIVQCRDCGYVATCARCAVPLAYHSADGRLRCHHCNRRRRPLANCQECRSGSIRQLGIGTQRVVDEVSGLLPGVKVQRWDSDAAGSGVEPGAAMRQFASGETQVLVGTQVVAKGLDVANVTVVGMVLADVGLHLPDFRAGERSFGLLCQVAGRAGRGKEPGRAFIQTYVPEHYAITAAAQQDYAAMYDQEIASRRQLGNPPFNRLVHLVFQDSDETACQRQAINTAREIRRKAYAQGLSAIEIIGPAPGFPPRLRGRHRWHLTIRGPNLQRFLDDFRVPTGCTVDVDPVHVL